MCSLCTPWTHHCTQCTLHRAGRAWKRSFSRKRRQPREKFAYLHGKFIYDTASQLAEEKALHGPCQNGRFRYSLFALNQNLLFLFTSFVYLFLFFRQQVRTLILWKIAVSCLDFLFFVFILCIKVMVWKLQPLNKAILHVLPVI